MASVSDLNVYERVTLSRTAAAQFFFFALHMGECNSLHVGAGMETHNELQRAHITGPQVHELHLDAFTRWLERLKPTQVRFVERLDSPRHPLSSQGQTAGEYADFLETQDELVLAAGRFLPLAEGIEAMPVSEMAEAVARARIDAFSHPLHWELHYVELGDGRFVWMSYDADLEKIRIGMGFYDAANVRQYGDPSYAVNMLEAIAFGARLGQPEPTYVPFMAFPPRWPTGLPKGLHGEDCRKASLALYGWADKVWPGQMEAAVRQFDEDAEDVLEIPAYLDSNDNNR
ncbi:hypothetical protein KIKIMORA_03260 [Brevundimonas phage vB_BpoS-Kikimora]|uniref:Uncharacterized protein n=1 Tax=Brevundimonas phage vB_BpoS-Kikimora TaxID=2948601 RepID=A0A9E7MRT1_9CAUD|nr:hypothetical protein KIKIMORA_03260 [Brevundimonas phage vB_BpoS-Kikimora]